MKLEDIIYIAQRGVRYKLKSGILYCLYDNDDDFRSYLLGEGQHSRHVEIVNSIIDLYYQSLLDSIVDSE